MQQLFVILVIIMDFILSEGTSMTYMVYQLSLSFTDSASLTRYNCSASTPLNEFIPIDQVLCSSTEISSLASLVGVEQTLDVSFCRS